MGFTELHDQYRALYAEFRADREAMQEAFGEALRKAFKVAFPRREWDMSKACELPNYDEIRGEWQPKADALVERWDAASKEMKARMAEAAATEPVPTTDEMVLVDQVWGSSYHTQGFGANTYAENAARHLADKAVHHGLKAEVRVIRTGKGDRWGYQTQDYGVFANTTEAGWRMLKEHKPEVPLRDWIRACWGRGVNPRVYNPYLPHGIEEKLGLDRFGGETGPDTAAAPDEGIPAPRP